MTSPDDQMVSQISQIDDPVVDGHGTGAEPDCPVDMADTRAFCDCIKQLYQ